jgi:hypothetical protein
MEWLHNNPTPCICIILKLPDSSPSLDSRRFGSLDPEGVSTSSSHPAKPSCGPCRYSGCGLRLRHQFLDLVGKGGVNAKYFRPLLLFQPPAISAFLSISNHRIQHPSLPSDLSRNTRQNGLHGSPHRCRSYRYAHSHPPFAHALLADIFTTVLNNWLLTRSYIAG